MDNIQFGYSLKNIPLPSEEKYIFKLIERTEWFMKQMRWKAIFFEPDNANDNEMPENYLLRSRNCPPRIPELNNFENDLSKMIDNIKFKNVSSDFQKKLKDDVKIIRDCKDVIIAADKTQNYYKAKKEEHVKMLHDNITKNYKKANPTTPNDINKEAKKIAKKFGVDERADVMAKQQCFITVKDHKEDFRTNPRYRLLNPTKSNLGKISKNILQKANNQLRNTLGVNQWQNSSQVIDWFKHIENKNQHTFTTFDIKDFYPSIREDLLKKSINFAKKHTAIKPEEIEVIFHCRKSLLYHNNEPWVKKDGLFDVTMGSYDGAEICELVGLFLLDILQKRYKKANIGLYRDDGLAVFKNQSSRQNDMVRKEFIKFFKHHNLDLEITCNLKCVDFLDITFDLPNGVYKPYSKPNNESLYIHAKSNHPPPIIKQIAKSVSKRISNNSANKTLFDAAAPVYNDILEKCGYDEKIEYTPSTSTPTLNRRRNRNRKVLWYNPPFSMNVETNVAKKFLSLINKHFPRNHKYHKIFNRNCVKVSYSCMDSMSKILKSHNAKISKANDTPNPGCNCRDRGNCPLDRQCIQKSVVYQADVSINDNTTPKTYIGISEPLVKLRIANHEKAFNDRQYETDSSLSEYIWSLKDQGIRNYHIKWSILRRVRAWNSVTNKCGLCTMEKVMISRFKDKNNLINKRLDLVTKCRHQNKHLLCNYSGID